MSSWSWSSVTEVLLTPSPLSAWFWTCLLILLVLSYQIIFDRKLTRANAAGATLFLVAVLYGLATAASIHHSQSQLGHVDLLDSNPSFTAAVDADVHVDFIPNINDPKAIDAQGVCPGYTASDVVRTTYGLTARLTLAGKACNVYGTDVGVLNLTVEYQSSDRLHIEITPTYVDVSNTSWFALPEALVQKPSIDSDAETSSFKNDLSFSWSNTPSFSFTVSRKSTGDVLFSTEGKKLVFENQFIEFASSLPENYNLYGLAEVIHAFRLGNNFTRTFYAADAGYPIDMNIYGDHPFYLDTRYFTVDETTGAMAYVANATNVTAKYTSYTHGVYLRNSHGQEVLLRPSNITWRTLGGDIDLYFYAGPTPDATIKSYQKSIDALPAMQQYFTFGFHQCRYGYRNWSELQDVVDNFSRFGIPLETIWTDIDYMNQYRNFENDQKRFGYAEGKKFLEKIHANGQHYIPIVDSAIYFPDPKDPNDAYLTFERGKALDSFMLNPDGSLYVGQVWPGYTVFPDWVGAILNGTGTFKWWNDELRTWYQEIKFDGIWIDMNEVSSFCSGSCGSYHDVWEPISPYSSDPGAGVYQYPEGFEVTNTTEASSASVASSMYVASASLMAHPESTSSFSYLRATPTPGVRELINPPYAINNVNGPLEGHAVSPSATHHGGTVEYDYHNLFGHLILNATYHALLSMFPAKRPFIIGRSTFVGSGKWAGHWGGDNASVWAHLFFSIPQALSFALAGIPMFGEDVCGFHGNTDEELCNRWMQLGAFFPFYRNHNELNYMSQEPYLWASVIEASKTAMNIRYQLLPYLYTLFYQAHKTGSTVMRALAWEFPNDPTLASADRQFLLGGALMVTPVLVQGATSVDGVFPGVGTGEVWYDWYNQSAVTAGPGENITIAAPLGHIPIYIRGGNILPIQEPGMTTKECRANPWGLIVANGANGNAKGQLYLDDGERLKPNDMLLVELSLSGQVLHTSVQGTFVDKNPLANVTVLGVQGPVKKVLFNNEDLSSGWSWNDTTKVLQIKGLDQKSSNGAWNQDWTLSWSLEE
ncbi:glycosyl hydrolases family 31-domain-containing protein [Xylogone sp. PMI_703]|nr:glycosyl hydrolases family 31-domain-containing protein [Xylogone sp. PMI_703]